MEQNMVSSEPVINNGKSNTGKGWKIATIVASIVAICGIGFGVYGMMQSSQKDNQISDLKNQAKQESGTTAVDVPEEETPEEETPKEETPKEETKTETTKISGGPYIESGYFYVPKWGAKFKLSDSLTNYGYAVDQKNQGDSYGNYVVGLTAISKSDYQENPQSFYYNSIFFCSVVTIRAMEDSKKNWWNNEKADVEFNGYNFIIHDKWREDACNTGFSARTDTVAKQLKTILSKPEKI